MEDGVVPGVEKDLPLMMKANSFRSMEPCKCYEPNCIYAQSSFQDCRERLDTVCELILAFS